MKRIVCLGLLLCLLMPGCADPFKEPVTFYYLRKEFQFGVEDGVIASEAREASGHTDDLSYLIALYLMGPANEQLTSPLPNGTRILTSRVDQIIYLDLSDHAQDLADSDFTLACACLSLTCFGITNAQEVIITCGSRSITMDRDSLSLFDDSAVFDATEETQ